MRYLLSAALAAFFMVVAQARDTDGLSERLSPQQRGWVRDLKDHNNIPCCDTADGYDVPWEGTADGKYKVLIDGQWIDVPAAALLDDRPNLIGVARVWYWRAPDGSVMVRCFLPGGGT